MICKKKNNIFGITKRCKTSNIYLKMSRLSRFYLDIGKLFIMLKKKTDEA